MTKIYRVRDAAGNAIADFTNACEAEAFAQMLDYEVTITEVFRLRRRAH